MKTRWLVFVGTIVFVGCASLPDQIPTRPPAERAATDIARDEAQCDQFAKAASDGTRSRYRACMMARGYAATVYMDDLDRYVGLVQTRPHDPSEVIRDTAFCDHRADQTKKSDVVPLTPEQERSVEAAQALTMNPMRPNATRMLVACLHERGYAIVPWAR